MPALKRSLDGVEDALGAGDVLLRGAKPVLRGQHLEIGVGDRRQRGQRDDVAVETVGDRGLFRRLRGVAVLAPEIELVAGAERGRIVDHFAAAIGQAAGAGARGAGIGLLTVAVEARQQRRARDPRLRIGLPEPRGGGRDVQIDGLRLLHQAGQLPRAKAAPPVERRRRIRSLRKPGRLVAFGDVERGIGKILGQDAARGAGDEAEHRKRSRQPPAAGNERRPASERRNCNSLGHTRSPPGKSRPGARRTLVLDGLRHVHGVMLPLEPSRHTSLAIGRGQPRAALRRSSVRVAETGGKALASPYFIGFGAMSGRGRTAEILRRFHGAFPLF